MVESTTSARPLDPRSPYVLNTRDLGRQAGSMKVWRRTLPSPSGLGLDVIGVPAGASLDLDLRLEAVSEGVLVTGTITAPLEGECGRCLDPVSETVTVDVCELFAYPDSATDSTTEEDEVHRIVRDLLDLEPVVRDDVVLALPLTPLCRPDCAGLCPQCGQHLDQLPADHAHDAIDPRWAALSAFSSVPSPSSQE